MQKSTTTTTLTTTKKKGKPPKLSLAGDSSSVRSIIDPRSNISLITDQDDDTLSSPALSSGSSSPIELPLCVETDSDANSDDLERDIAKVEKLRRNVHKNLRLRPLRSSNGAQFEQFPPRRAFPSQTDAVYDFRMQPTSPTSALDSSIPSPSIYYTPTTELRSPLSARYVGHLFSFRDSDPPAPLAPPRIQQHAPLHNPRALDPATVFKRVSASKRPLLFDTRQLPSYLAERIEHSFNIAIPPLILRRCKKPGGGFASLDLLRPYITTDHGKQAWDEIVKPGGVWDGDVIVYDDIMDEHCRDSSQSLAWALLPLLAPLTSSGSVDYLKGGFSAARLSHDSHHHIIIGDHEHTVKPGLDIRIDAQPSPRRGGLFQLDTLAASRIKAMPEVEPSSSPGSVPVAELNTRNSNSNMLRDLTPSPSPSSLAFFAHASHMPKPNMRSLRRIQTSSAERLVPKLSVRTAPMKPNNIHIPPLNTKLSATSLQIQSPVVTMPHSIQIPNGSSSHLAPPQLNGSVPHTPRTPTGFPSSPNTARPDHDQPPTTEDAVPAFTVSTILPNFLFLGPELTDASHVEELLSLGVKRILNIAVECDDDQGLNLRQTFERYSKIPMRDTVVEENVARSVKEACEILDDARLHSAPTYVHCRAGKSRSVTAVIAYLIHANHWTLSRAYAFVLERRKGISPNIGFVSELMSYEERELGGKSTGVANSAVSAGGDGDDHDGGKSGNFSYAVGSRRAGHVRESLPPAFQAQNSETMIPGQPTSGGLTPSAVARVGDVGQEVEIKDESGRYRHVRRAPVDETTLQPMRRVSKAGLESTSYSAMEL